jgi:hypothetical protein
MSSEKYARAMLTSLQRGFPPVHEFRIVDGSTFQHVSHRFYDQTCAALGAMGFRQLGDLEDVTAKQTKPDLRTFMRLMVDADNTTVASCYHLVPRFPWGIMLTLLRIPRKLVEFESYSGEEYTHCTTMAPASTTVPRPATLTKEHVPLDTLPAAMYKRHRESIAALPSPLRSIKTISEAMNQQISQHARLRRYMESIGWLTRDYIRSQRVPASMVDEVYEAAQELIRSGFGAEVRTS